MGEVGALDLAQVGFLTVRRKAARPSRWLMQASLRSQSSERAA
jgi:hypothetical protein